MTPVRQIFLIFPLLFLLLLPLSGATAETRGITVKARKADGSTEQINLYRSSYALLVGESEYAAGWPRLESIPGELDQVEEVLAAHGFQTFKHLNLASGQLKKTFDLSCPRKLQPGKPLILAVGVEPDNVAHVISEVRPLRWT